MSIMNTIKLHAAEYLWKLPKATFTDPQAADLSKQLVENGCCVIENFMSPEQVDTLVANAERAYKQFPDRVSLESNGADQRIYAVDHLDKSFLLTEELAVADRINAAFDRGSNKTWFQMIGKITYKEGNLGSGSGWHRDSPFTHQFKAILYLTDVTEENGPFEYIKGTHRKDSLKETAKFLGIETSQYRFSPEQIERLEASGIVPKRTTVTGKKGTLLMADVRGLHWGKPLRSGQRMAITRYFFPNGVPAHFSKLYPQAVL